MEWYGLVVRKSRGGGRVAAYMRCEGVLWMCGAGIDRGEIPERSVIGHLRAGINHKPKGQQGAKDVGRSRLGSWTAMMRFADDQDSHGAPMHDPDQDTATRAEVAVCQSHAPVRPRIPASPFAIRTGLYAAQTSAERIKVCAYRKGSLKVPAGMESRNTQPHGRGPAHNHVIRDSPPH